MPNYRLSTTALLTLTISGFAQPDFTADQFFKAGDIGKVGFAVKIDSFEVFLRQTGDDHLWDFSGEGWTTPTGSYSIRDAESTNRPTFAASKLNEYALTTIGRDVYYSHSEGGDTVYLDGLMSGATAYAYQPRVPYVAFPLAFGDSAEASANQYAIPTQPTNATGSVRRWWSFDGYGTVKLPYGEAEAVYRIRTHQVDSSFVLKTGTVYEELIWFRNEGGVPLLRLVKQGTAVAIYYASLEDQSPIRFAPNRRAESDRTGRMIPASFWASRPAIQVTGKGLHDAVFDGLGRRISH
jgi:hypothetical protein